MRRDSLPSNARRRPSQTMHFGAQSRGLRAPCERFAPGVTPGPRITRFRLAADLGRMGLDTHRVSNKVSKITSRHLVPLDRAFPAHALVHESKLGRCCVNRNWHGTLPTRRFVTNRSRTTLVDHTRSSDRARCTQAPIQRLARLQSGRAHSLGVSAIALLPEIAETARWCPSPTDHRQAPQLPRGVPHADAVGGPLYGSVCEQPQQFERPDKGRRQALAIPHEPRSVRIFGRQ